METRRSWGMVFMGIVFVALAAGIAGTTYYLEKQKTPEEKPAVENMNVLGWANVGTSSSPTTADFSKALVYAYADFSANGGTTTPAERQKMIDEVIAKNIVAPKIVPNITADQLNVSGTITAE